VHSAGAGRSVQGMQICTVKRLRSRKRRLFLGLGMLDWDSNAAFGAYHKASRQHAANTVSCGEAFHHLVSVGIDTRSDISAIHAFRINLRGSLSREQSLGRIAIKL
jgi:hypothetical protein